MALLTLWPWGFIPGTPTGENPPAVGTPENAQTAAVRAQPKGATIALNAEDEGIAVGMFYRLHGYTKTFMHEMILAL